jgi:hypothetical protein
MPTIRRESRSCPVCSLPLTVIHTDNGVTFEYDMAEWVRLCRHADAGSPVACPGARPVVDSRPDGS